MTGGGAAPRVRRGRGNIPHVPSRPKSLMPAAAAAGADRAYGVPGGPAAALHRYAGIRHTHTRLFSFSAPHSPRSGMTPPHPTPSHGGTQTACLRQCALACAGLLRVRAVGRRAVALPSERAPRGPAPAIRHRARRIRGPRHGLSRGGRPAGLSPGAGGGARPRRRLAVQVAAGPRAMRCGPKPGRPRQRGRSPARPGAPAEPGGGPGERRGRHRRVAGAGAWRIGGLFSI